MKFPTIVGLLLVVTFVGSIVFVSERAFRGPTEASISTQPKTVELSNISDTSVTVNWITQAAATGVIEISSSLTNRLVAYDERDSNGKLGKYVTHSVTTRNLKPNTEYTIRILSNGKSYTDASVSRIKTASSLTTISGGLEPAYGMIRTSDGLPADGALVFVTLEGGQTLSTITKPSGSWLVPLSISRTEDLSAYLPTIERMTEQILVRWGEDEITAITDSLNDSPTPEMTMGKTYDFRKLQAKTTSDSQLALRTTPPSGAVDSSKATQQIGVIPPIGGSVLGTQTGKSYKVVLIQPADGSAVSSNLPLVSGTGIPNAAVSISLGITKPISGSTKVNADGTWNFTPPKRLGAGKQSVTITSVDEKGKPIAITHMFEILKSGTQVLGDATPSATHQHWPANRFPQVDPYFPHFS
jgi:Bacterial Ig-like domain/Purple acid Phosphatase, N-terminal domain